MKGLSLVTIVDAFAFFVIVITFLPAINAAINGVSSSLDSAQLIIAGLFGVFLLLRVVKFLFADRGQQQFIGFQ